MEGKVNFISEDYTNAIILKLNSKVVYNIKLLSNHLIYEVKGSTLFSFKDIMKRCWKILIILLELLMVKNIHLKLEN